MRFDPPEGYILDTATGLYYTQIIAKDADEKISQVVTWFDAETGEYRQEIYPVDLQEGTAPVGTESWGRGSGERTVSVKKTGRKSPGSPSSARMKPVNKVKLMTATAASLLAIALIVTAVVIVRRVGRSEADVPENDVVILDKTIGENAGAADESGNGAEPDTLESIASDRGETAEDLPQAQNQPQIEAQAEEISETDSVMDESASDNEYSMGNCYGVDEDELLKANITISEITQGNSYCNGEMTEYFTILEAGEYGITRIFYHTEPLNDDKDIMEYNLSLAPLGARFSTLYDQGCIETKARGGGMEITFYVFTNGSSEVDAQSVVVDESEHSEYERLSFGGEYPGDYYQFDL